MTSSRSRLFDSVIVSSWWVILFLLTLFFIYDQAINKRNREERTLIQKRETLLVQKQEALDHLEDLQLRKSSQDDPAWIEIVLKEKLGLCGEKQTKVLFQ
ncbi:MAG: hypothetical protein H7A36_05545 [Chlamydiales bacterium]|nr:hypothetical protein [Chlamydiales bacterium]